MRYVLRNNNGNMIGSALSVGVVIVVLSTVFVTMYNEGLSEDAISKKVDVGDKALEVLNMLIGSYGITSFNSDNWEDSVDTPENIVHIGFLDSVNSLDDDVGLSNLPILDTIDNGEPLPLDDDDTNTKPNTPSAPMGVVSGFVNVQYNYISSATDPDGDDLMYFFVWDDGDIGTEYWYPSGTLVSCVKDGGWLFPGVYDIFVLAFDGELLSDPSPITSVTISVPGDDDDDSTGGGQIPICRDGQICAYDNCYPERPCRWRETQAGCYCECYETPCPGDDDDDDGGNDENAATESDLSLNGDSDMSGEGDLDYALMDVDLKTNCFLSGSLVLTPLGFDSIEDFVVGDDIVSYNLESEEFEVDKVLNVFRDSPDLMADYYLVLSVGGFSVGVTPDHPVFVDGEWVLAENLRVGDCVSSGAVISSIERVFDRVRTFNLDVESNDNFVVRIGDDFLIAHNAESMEKPGEGEQQEQKEQEEQQQEDQMDDDGSSSSNFYSVGGFDEEKIIRKIAADNDFSALLGYDKIIALYDVEPDLVRSTFGIPDDIDFVISVKALNGQDLLHYCSDVGYSYSNSRVVASQSANVLVRQVNDLTNSIHYSFSEITVEMSR